MGRLEHLKLSLPAMLCQPNSEIIVVDYSCPEGTAKFVSENFPSVRVVKVEGEQEFSNWKARNAGAAAATSDMLLFCDADTILAADAVAIIARDLPPESFGFLPREVGPRLKKGTRRFANNQFRGFHVIPSKRFRSVGGYDEVLRGYAAGGDTDLENRLLLTGMRKFKIDDRIIADVIDHDDEARFRHHSEDVRRSHGAGLLYWSAKLAILRLRGRTDLALEMKQKLYRIARQSISTLGTEKSRASLTALVDEQPLKMPGIFGYRKGTRKVFITVKIALEDSVAPKAARSAATRHSAGSDGEGLE